MLVFHSPILQLVLPKSSKKFFNQIFPFCTLLLMKISRKIDFLNQIKPMHDGMKIDFENDFLIMTSLMFPIS